MKGRRDADTTEIRTAIHDGQDQSGGKRLDGSLLQSGGGDRGVQLYAGNPAYTVERVIRQQ